MNGISVALIIKPSINPKELVGGLARLTQVKKGFDFTSAERGERIIDAISTMGHTSLLEPLRFGFVISGASRIFLAQITRHRHATYVSQSQQYQDHSDFPYVTIPEVEGTLLEQRYHTLMVEAAALYADMKAMGIPQDQARYVIPGAARNDLFIDASARELIEVMFPQRICRRNTHESRVIIAMMLRVLFSEGYEYLFKHTGCACVTVGKCDQGKMCCGRPYKSFDEMLEI